MSATITMETKAKFDNLVQSVQSALEAFEKNDEGIRVLEIKIEHAIESAENERDGISCIEFILD